ncbi:MAG: flagellar protein FlgN [Candidatus Thiodiazotropha sp. 6PLUC2]
MQNNTQHQTTFSKLLNSEIEQTQTLLELLKREFELLKAPPSIALEELTEQKKQLLLEVEKSVSQHNQLLVSQGYSSDRKGNKAFIQQCQNSDQLDQLWRQFSSLLEACQKQNEINGGAVQLNQHQVAQALDILRGCANSDKTYGPAGESRPTTSSKSLGKA